MSENAEILFTNETFYHVFRTRDLGAMDDLWARRAPVVCAHPGWQALTTREAVMESWRGILSNPDAPPIACRAPRAYVEGGLGFVVCYEVVGESVLVATNIFAREDGAWKMVHHQAGPCRAAPGEIEAEAPHGPMQ